MCIIGVTKVFYNKTSVDYMYSTSFKLNLKGLDLLSKTDSRYRECKLKLNINSYTKIM